MASNRRKFRLIEKFFALRKTDDISMDAYLIEVRDVADRLEELGCKLPEEMVVYWTIHRLPKEYQIFKRIIFGGDNLPIFEVLQVKLLDEEIAIALESDERDGQAVAYQGRRNLHGNRRPATAGCPGSFISQTRRPVQGF